MDKIVDESFIVLVRFVVLFLAGIISAKRFMNPPQPLPAPTQEQLWRERAVYWRKVAYKQYHYRKQAEARYQASLEMIEAIGIRHLLKTQRRS